MTKKRRYKSSQNNELIEDIDNLKKRYCLSILCYFTIFQNYIKPNQMNSNIEVNMKNNLVSQLKNVIEMIY